MDIELPVVPDKKGLDPQQVNVALTDVQIEVSRLESERAEIDKRVDKLTREIAEVRSALKRSSAKPSFSDLGAAFEQTLRVAEEQAGKLIADAQTTSALTRRSAEEEAIAVTENANKQAAKLISETEARVERLIKESEKKLSEALSTARSTLANAEIQHEEAMKIAEAITIEGAQKRETLETELAQEIEQSRNEIATLRQVHERDKRRIEEEIEVLRAKAERDNGRLIAENETYIAKLLEESQKNLDIARKRAREILVESQKNFAASRQEGVALVREARETAAGIIRRARARANTLTERLEERSAILLENGENLLDGINTEREAVEAFNSELRIIALSEQSKDDDNLLNYVSVADDELAEELTVEALDMNDDSLTDETKR